MWEMWERRTENVIAGNFGALSHRSIRHVSINLMITLVFIVIINRPIISGYKWHFAVAVLSIKTGFAANLRAQTRDHRSPDPLKRACKFLPLPPRHLSFSLSLSLSSSSSSSSSSSFSSFSFSLFICSWNM